MLNHVLRKETKWKKTYIRSVSIFNLSNIIYFLKRELPFPIMIIVLDRGMLLVQVLLRYNWIDRHHGLINRYKISASQRTKNMFHLSWPQSSSSFFVYDLSPSGAPEFTSVLSGVRVTRSLVLYVCFVDRFLSFCTFSFGHCVVCSSSIYGFWLPLWYLQTFLRMSTMTGAINGTGTAYPSENLKLNLSFKSSSHCSIFCLSLGALWRYGQCVVIQYILMVTQYFITCSPNFDTKYVAEIQNSNFNRPLPVSLQLVPLS